MKVNVKNVKVELDTEFDVDSKANIKNLITMFKEGGIMNFKFKDIKIEFEVNPNAEDDKTVLTITFDEAKELYEELHKLFGVNISYKQYMPNDSYNTTY